MIAGRCYLERGHPVTVLVGWGPGGGEPGGPCPACGLDITEDLP